MQKQHSLITGLAICTAIALSACGGGGGAPTSAGASPAAPPPTSTVSGVTAKYQGTWQGECNPYMPGAYRATFRIVENTIDWVDSYFPNTSSCAGTAGATMTYPLTTYTVTSQIDANTIAVTLKSPAGQVTPSGNAILSTNPNGTTFWKIPVNDGASFLTVAATEQAMDTTGTMSLSSDGQRLTLVYKQDGVDRPARVFYKQSVN